ncbi:MAG: hypothetical protein ABMA64_33630, partial [Myxococcota bacterium]
GEPTGPAVVATMGANGGELVAGDGAFRLEVPAGALAERTEFSVQPIHNTAWGGLGGAWRVSPAMAFAAPVQLTFALTAADLDGTAAGAVGVARQDPDGYWVAFADGAVDGDAGTLTVETDDLGSQREVDLAAHWRIRLEPPTATVAPGATRALELTATANALQWPFPDDAQLDLGPPAPYVSDEDVAWTVTGSPAGTVSGDRGSATFTAPEHAPCDSVNAVVATLAGGLEPRSTLWIADACTPTTPTDHDTPIEPGEWVGQSLTEGSGFEYYAEVVWSFDRDDVGVQRFTPTGTVTASVYQGDCTIDPLTHTIGPQDGELFVDPLAMTWSGQGVTVWTVTVTCPGAVVTLPFPVAWFGDFDEILTSSGEIERNDGYQVIAGGDEADGTSISWSFLLH